MVAGSIGVFALHEVPSRRFALRSVCFEAPVCNQWLRDPFSAGVACVCKLLTEEGRYDT